jgi:hypothetical protein
MSTRSEKPDKHNAETVIGGGECELPIGGYGTVEGWQSILEGNTLPETAILTADVLAMRAGSVLPPKECGSVQVDISRIELIFVGLKQNYDLLRDQPEELHSRDDKRAEIIETAIETATLSELIQIGEFLSKNQHLCPELSRFAELMGKIFGKLKPYEKEIQQIARSRAWEVLSSGETKK